MNKHVTDECNVALVEARGGLKPMWSFPKAAPRGSSGLPRARSTWQYTRCVAHKGRLHHAFILVSPGLGPGLGSQQTLKEFRELNSMPRRSLPMQRP